MKKWILTAVIILVFIATGVYVRIWLPHLLPWLRENSTVLQGLSSGIQVLLWVFAALVFVLRIVHFRNKVDQSPIMATIRNPQPNTFLNGIKNSSKLGGFGHHAARLSHRSLSAVHQLPPAPADFTGRGTQLKGILTILKRKKPTVAAFFGIGGIGKTSLALSAATRLVSIYKTAQIYLDVKGSSDEPLSPKAILAHVILSFDMTAQLPENISALTALYHSLLHKKRVLILLDNVRDVEQITPLIPSKGSLLLVTSRKRFALPGLIEENLGALSLDESKSLLLRIAPHIILAGDDCVGELANLCGNFPLALRTIASTLKVRVNINPAEYVQKLANAKERYLMSNLRTYRQVSHGRSRIGLKMML